MARTLLPAASMTTEKRALGMLAGLAALAALAAVVLLGMRDNGTASAPHASETPHEETTSAPSLLSAAAPKSAPPPPAARATQADAVAALRKGLASEDEAVRIAAVESAAALTATSTLPDLERFDLVRDPETAPTVIHSIALLGASAEGKERERAAATLDSWLASEMKRDTADARGNVSNLVEALGDLGGRDAVQSLDALLDRGDAAIHLQTLAVQKLGELGDATARPSVERFAQRTAALPPAEGLDEELRVEAIAAARATLAKL